MGLRFFDRLMAREVLEKKTFKATGHKKAKLNGVWRRDAASVFTSGQSFHFSGWLKKRCPLEAVFFAIHVQVAWQIGFEHRVSGLPGHRRQRKRSLRKKGGNGKRSQVPCATLSQWNCKRHKRKRLRAPVDKIAVSEITSASKEDPPWWMR